jgi:excisionase family DNA binding protein
MTTQDTLCDYSIAEAEQSSNISPSDGDSLWTVRDVARYLQLKPETVRAMARQEKFPAIKVGKVWRFDRRVVKNWLQTTAEKAAQT